MAFPTCVIISTITLDTKICSIIISYDTIAALFDFGLHVRHDSMTNGPTVIGQGHSCSAEHLSARLAGS